MRDPVRPTTATRTGRLGLPGRAALVALVLLGAACSSNGSRADGPRAERRLTSHTTVGPMGTTGATSESESTERSASSAPRCRPGRPAPDVDGPQSIRFAGQDRQYLISLPTDYDPTRGAPLLLDFHGSGSNMFGQAAYSDLPGRGAAAGFVVITPDGTGSPLGWDLLATAGGNDFDFAHVLIATAERTLCIDPRRIDAAGISLGSEFSSVLACQPPDDFAAIGLVASEGPPSCPPEALVSVIAFQGTADPIVPFLGGPVPSSGRGDRQFAPSTESTLAAWAAHDGCTSDPAVRRPGTQVRQEVWSACRAGSAVELYAIEGGGHTWPGAADLSSDPALTRLGPVTQQVSATDLMLAFFAAHPRP